jgi:hypothetical protein
MRDDEFSTAFMVRYLKTEAAKDAEEGEFHKEEHTCWMIATRLEELEAVVECLDPEGNPSADKVASLLKRIAGSIQHGKYYHKYTASDDIKAEESNTTTLTGSELNGGLT